MQFDILNTEFMHEKSGNIRGVSTSRWIQCLLFSFSKSISSRSLANLWLFSYALQVKLSKSQRFFAYYLLTLAPVRFDGEFAISK